MTSLLGSKYQIVTQDGAHVVLDNVPGSSDLAISAPEDSMTSEDLKSSEDAASVSLRGEKTADDYLFQIYVGSLTVVGLFVLFRMIRKSR